MKKAIKISLIIAVAILYNTTKGTAQSSPVVCKIAYDYDVAGNRIKREYKCEATWNPWDPAPWTDPILISITPNPTTGTITGTFSTPIGGESGGRKYQ